MFRFLTTTVAFLLGFLSLLGFGVAGTALAKNRPLATGVTVSDLGPKEQLGMDRIRAAGATRTRVLIRWRLVAPSTEPGSWDPTDPSDLNYEWGEYDNEIQMARRAGLDPIVAIYSAPDWAERCEHPTPGICDPDPVKFAQFTRAAARRYSGDFQDLPRVRFWTAWNEPNLHLFFQPQFRAGKKASPGLYREMLNRFAGAVKGVDSTNRVVGGGLAPLKRPGGLGPLDFSRRVLCMQGRKRPKPARGCSKRARFDIWANNPYTTGGPTHSSAGRDDVSLGDLPEMAKLLRSARRAGKIRTSFKSIPFWVTEFSWDSAPPDPGGLPMKVLTRWTSEAMFRAWQAGVSNFFWLSLRDWNRPEGLPYSQTIESGLYFRGATIEEDRPKKNLRAFEFPFVAFGKSKGILVWGRTPTSTGGKVALSYRKGGWKRIGTVRADTNGVFKTVLKSRLARKFGPRKQGTVRARYGGKDSVPFSLRPVRDFRQPPFG